MRPRWVLLAVLLSAAELPAEPPKTALPDGAILRLGVPGEGHRKPPTAVVFAEAGKAICTGTEDDLCRWDAATGKLTKQVRASAQVLAVSSDGMHVAGGATFGDTAVWTAPSLERAEKDTSGFMGDLSPPVLQAAPNAIFAGRSRHGDIVPHGWDDVAVGLKPYRSARESYVSRDGWSFAVAPDGRSAVIAESVVADGGVRVPRKKFDVDARLVWWDFAAGKVTQTRPNGLPPRQDDEEKTKRDPADAAVSPLAFLPGGRQFVAESAYGFLLMRGDTGERVRVLCPRWRLAVERPAPRGYVDRHISFAVSPDGRLLAVGRDRGILLIEVVSGCIRWSFDPGERVTALAFSPDGARLASGGDGGSTLLWDVYAADGRPADVSQLKSERVSAHQAMSTLLRQPAALVAVAKTLPAVMKLDAAQIRRWLVDLDNPRYAVRETAQGWLAKLPLEVRPTIEAYLKTPGLSPEAITRAERARDALPPAPVVEELWRVSRILEMLERLNTPEARAEMARLAAGEAGYALTVEATESLTRMAKRAK